MNRASKEKKLSYNRRQLVSWNDTRPECLLSAFSRYSVFIQEKEPNRKQYYRMKERHKGLNTYGVASLIRQTKLILMSLISSPPSLSSEHTHSSYKFVYFLLDWQAHRSMGCQISPNILLTILFIAYLKYFTQARPKC